MADKYFKLHLELNIDGADMKTLQKYGKVEKGITRDFLVTHTMPLHNLHYAIQKAFGWQNSHLHMFEYPKETIRFTFGNTYKDVGRYCGLYFRYPTSNFEDLYWDDDHDSFMPFDKWLKKKYSPPFVFGGVEETFTYAYMRADKTLLDDSRHFVPVPFSEYMKGKEGGRETTVADMTLDEAWLCMEGNPADLIERRPIGEYLTLRLEDGWRVRMEEIAEKGKECNDKIKKHYPKLATTVFAGNSDKETGDKVKKILSSSRVDITESESLECVPLSDTLLYSYDTGDGWEVKITLLEEYSVDKDKMQVRDSEGNIVKDVELLTPMLSGVPIVCTSADGLPVMDDIGGLDGYCDFLQRSHINYVEEEFLEEKYALMDWAYSQGWTGRMKKPKNIL